MLQTRLLAAPLPSVLLPRLYRAPRYNGLTEPDKHEWKLLDPKTVREIHMKGGASCLTPPPPSPSAANLLLATPHGIAGSVLKAGRGGFDAPKICDTLRAKAA